MDCDGKGQSQVHPRGVELHFRVNEFFDFGEGHDGVESSVDLLLAHAEDRAIEINIVPAAEVGMEAGANLDQPGHPSPRGNASRVGEHHAGDMFQESRFP